MNIRKTRIKLIGLLLCSTGMVFVRSPLVICIITAIIVAFGVRFLRYRVMQKRLYPILIIGFFVILYQLLFHTTLLVQNRLLEGFIQLLRLISLSLLVFLFTETTSVSEIVSSLSFLPRKVSLMLTISFALIPAILREITVIRTAQQARGFAPRGIHLFRLVLPILIPLLTRTLTRAEHIAVVLEA